jgi:predicted transposase/invertase (TIGR01784 family)
MSDQLTNPHDAFFKTIWSRPDVAWDFVTHYLPAEIAARLVPGSLQLCKDSFVDPALHEYFSDLLYQVDLRDGGRVFIYVLLEHKSFSDNGTPLQLAQYLVRIWDQEQQQTQSPWRSPIIPIVVYHGRGRWRAVRQFQDLFPQRAGLENYIPAFCYELCDLSHLSDEAIKGQVLLRVALLVLKYIFRRELRRRLPEILGLLRELGDQRRGLEFLQVLLKYLAVAGRYLDPDTLRQAVRVALSQPEDDVMATVAEIWVQEGLQRGLQQGAENNARENVLALLEDRFGTLPVELTATLEGIRDLARLKQLLLQAAKTPSPAAFLQMCRGAS